MKKVLIIEDDRDFSEVVSKTLSSQYQTLQALSGPEGLRLATNEKPDLILIDLQMPEMDGFTVCEELRSRPMTREIPIIILTGENQPDSRVRGLDAGADDYVSKPFHTQELLARIRARLRRRESNQKITTEIQVGNLRMEPLSSQVWVGEVQIHLTQVELQVLKYFLEYPNEMISRERLLGDLWPDSIVTSRTVDTHVAHCARSCMDFRTSCERFSGAATFLKSRASRGSGVIMGKSSGKCKVLVIDDEEALAQVIEYALSRDCEVVIATRSEKGRDLLLGAEEFDLIFCDLVMPGMNGIELYQQVVQAKPQLRERVIFMSGGGISPEAREFIGGLPKDRLVEKPFSLKTIRELVGTRMAKLKTAGPN